MSKITFDEVSVGAIFLVIKREDGTFSPVSIPNNKEVEDILASIIEAFGRAGHFAYNKDVVLIKKTEAKEAQRWIPVDEELPPTPDDVSENVLLKISVYNKKSKNTYECCIESWYDGATEIWHTMIDISKKDLVFTALAWRPIERK